MPDDLVPFRVDVPEQALDDLRRRLAATRWPEAETVDDWSQGVPLAYLQELCAHWRDAYDWRVVERRLNALPQLRANLDGLWIHALHVRSPHDDALPLVLTHGWPGSVLEFLDVVGPLTDPAAHGGDAADAFHVVCPSLPGYGFSDKADRPGWSTKRIAGAWAELMERLGYERYGAHGGDWGSPITMLLAHAAPERLAGIHLTMPVAPARAVAELGELTSAEQRAMADYAEHLRWGTGYSKQQSTRPQTLGYGLTESPAGQCAWIVEKFAAWMDCDGRPENVLTRDGLLDGVSLYWLTASAASSARLYWESFGDTDIAPIEVPAGCSIFPKELFRMPRRLAERRLRDLRHWNELDRGGHFPALERPGVLVDELRAFFRPLRGG